MANKIPYSGERKYKDKAVGIDKVHDMGHVNMVTGSGSVIPLTLRQAHTGTTRKDPQQKQATLWLRGSRQCSQAG